MSRENAPTRENRRPTAAPAGSCSTVTRVWIPVAIAVAGIVGDRHRRQPAKDDIVAGAGVSLVIAALIVWMINWMYRLSVESNRDREREEEAREYFDVHGRWPDE